MSSSVCLGALDAIPESGSKGYHIQGHALFAVRQGSHIYVYRNSCPHLGIELEWCPDRFLDPQQQFIQCATHGALFLIASGECISGPCSGEHLSSVPCELKDGHIWVRL